MNTASFRTVFLVLIFCLTAIAQNYVEPYQTSGDISCGDLDERWREYTIYTDTGGEEAGKDDERTTVESGKTGITAAERVFAIKSGREFKITFTQVLGGEDLVFDWSANFPVKAVIVSEGYYVNVYEYGPEGAYLGTCLHSPYYWQAGGGEASAQNPDARKGRTGLNSAGTDGLQQTECPLSEDQLEDLLRIYSIRICYTNETALKIEKVVEGFLPEPETFTFEVYPPEEEYQTVDITVPAGLNPSASITIPTTAGVHYIEEYWMPGYEPQGDPWVDISVAANDTPTVTFVNRQRFLTGDPTCAEMDLGQHELTVDMDDEDQVSSRVFQLGGGREIEIFFTGWMYGDLYTFDWTANFAVNGVLVSEGYYSNYYHYGPTGAYDDDCLHAPLYPDYTMAGLSPDEKPAPKRRKQQYKGAAKILQEECPQSEEDFYDYFYISVIRICYDEKPAFIEIEKTVQGELDAPEVFEFEIVDPEGSTTSVQIEVPAGTNPVASMTLPTIIGNHTVTESQKEGFAPAGPVQVDVYVADNSTGHADFVNEPLDLTRYGCVDGYYYHNGMAAVQDNESTIYLEPVEGDTTFKDNINPETGYYKFHNIPFGDYILYADGFRDEAREVTVWRETAQQCCHQDTRITTGCRRVLAWYHENDFQYCTIDTPLIGLYGPRDLAVIKYHALMADRLNIDAFIIRIDELLNAFCDDDCFEMYGQSLIKEMLETVDALSKEYPDFKLRIMAAWDLEAGDPYENPLLLDLLADSVFTHPGYYSTGGNKPLVFINSNQSHVSRGQDFEDYWTDFKNIVASSVFPHQVSIMTDIDPFSTLPQQMLYFRHHVNAVYPRVDFSDNEQTPWQPDGSENGFSYLQEYYKKMYQLGVPLDVGGIWSGWNDYFYHPQHYTTTAAGDTVFLFIDKEDEDGNFKTLDSTWVLAYQYKPFLLILETFNNYNEHSHISPSLNYQYRLTMDYWEKINQRKSSCEIWDTDVRALEYLYHWYRAVTSERTSVQKIRTSLDAFFLQDYDTAIDLITPLPENFALSFDGEDDFVRVADAPVLDVTNRFTIEFWVNPRSPLGQNAKILEKGTWDQYAVGFYSKSSRIAGAMRCEINGKSRMKNVFGPSGMHLEYDRWYHVALTYDGETAKLYIDGLLESEQTVTATPRRTTGDLIIGAVQRGNGLKNFLHGTLDDLRIWNTARSIQDIMSGMYSDVPADKDGLVVCYPFNEGSGQIVRDCSPNQLHGRLGVLAEQDTGSPAWVVSDRPMGWDAAERERAIRILREQGGRKRYVPDRFALLQNYPNPFNSTTTIEYHVPEDVHVKLEIFDVTGRKVTTLTDSYHQAGEYIIDWYTAGIPSGLYFYRLKTVDYQETRRMTLLK